LESGGAVTAQGRLVKDIPYFSESSSDRKKKFFLTVVIRPELFIFTRKGHTVERRPPSQPFSFAQRSAQLSGKE